MSAGMVNRLESMSRRWTASDRAMSGSLQRLGSGQRIVTAADDAAGLAIAERLRGQSAGALRAQRNVQDGISALQTVDGALAEATSILQRTRELAVRFQNGTLNDADRAAAQREAHRLGEEVARLAAATSFNGSQMLAGGALVVHVGGHDDDGIATLLPDLDEFIDAALFELDGSGGTTTTTTSTTTTTTTVGGGGNGNGNGNGSQPKTKTKVVTETLTFTTPEGPPIARIDGALAALSAHRASLGGFQNRLEYALSALAAGHEQLVAAESRIRDADVAAELVALTRQRVAGEVNRALTAQAHVEARRALKLLAA